MLKWLNNFLFGFNQSRNYCYVKTKQKGNAAGLIVVSLALVSVSASLLSNMSNDDIVSLEQSNQMQEQLQNYGQLCLNDVEKIVNEARYDRPSNFTADSPITDISPTFFEKDFTGWDSGENKAFLINPPAQGSGEKDNTETRPFYAPAIPTTTQGPNTSVLHNFLEKGFQLNDTYLSKNYSTAFQGRELTYQCRIAYDTERNLYGLKRYVNPPDNKKVQIKTKTVLIETGQEYQARKILTDEALSENCSYEKEDLTFDIPSEQLLTATATSSSIAVGRSSGYNYQIGNNRICQARVSSQVNSTMACTKLTNSDPVQDTTFQKYPLYLIASYRNNYSGTVAGSEAPDNKLYTIDISFKVTDPSNHKGFIIVTSRSFRGGTGPSAVKQLNFIKYIQHYPSDLNLNTVDKYFKAVVYPATTRNQANQVTVVYQRDNTMPEISGLYRADFRWGNDQTLAGIGGETTLKYSVDANNVVIYEDDTANPNLITPLNTGLKDGWDLNATTGELLVIHADALNASSSSDPTFKYWTIGYNGIVPNNKAEVAQLSPITYNDLGRKYFVSKTQPAQDFAVTADKILQVELSSTHNNVAMFTAKSNAFNSHAAFAINLAPNKKIGQNGRLSSAPSAPSTQMLLSFPGAEATSLFLTRNNNDFYFLPKTDANDVKDKIYHFSSERWGFPEDELPNITNSDNLAGEYKNVFQYSLNDGEPLWPNSVLVPPQFIFTSNNDFVVRTHNKLLLKKAGMLTVAAPSLTPDNNANGSTKNIAFNWPLVYYTSGNALFEFNIINNQTKLIDNNLGANNTENGSLGILTNPEARSLIVISGKAGPVGSAKRYMPTCSDREFMSGEYNYFSPIGFEKTQLIWPDDHASLSNQPSRRAGL